MNLKSCLTFLVLASIVVSCQKSVGWLVDPETKEVIDTSFKIENPRTLNEMVSTTGSEGIQCKFTYDSLQRIASEWERGTSAGASVNSFKRFERDTLGRIVTIASITSPEKDTVYTEVYYDDERTVNFLRKTKTYKTAGALKRDSAVYTYDGNGHIAIEKVFSKTAGDYRLRTRKEFAYLNGNLVTSKNFEDSSNTGIMRLIAVNNYTYDNRINPFSAGVEWMLTGNLSGASRNNQVKLEAEIMVDPTMSFSVNTSFIYNSSRQPLSATSTVLPAGVTTQYLFSYQ